MSSKKKIIICVIAALMIAIAVFLIVLVGMKPHVSDLPEPISDDNNIKDQSKTDDPIKNTDNRKNGMYNILLFGKDYAGLNTDTMMVVSFDAENMKANVLQIPRDTRASDKYSSCKLNAVFSKGVNAVQKTVSDKDEQYKNGSLTLVSEIEDMLGIEIDYYVMVQLEGFKKIVDSIGGVTVDVPSNLNYDDPTQNLHIHLKKGEQTLNGEQAMQFVRFRKGYVTADIGRLDAQKIFMTAFLKKILSVQTVKSMPALVDQLKEYVSTSMTLTDMTSFAISALNMKMSDITFMTAPGEVGTSYYYLYPDLMLKIINEKFNVYKKEYKQSDLNIFIPDDYSYKYYDLADTEGTSADSIDNNGIKIPMAGKKSQSSSKTNTENTSDDLSETQNEQPELIESNDDSQTAEILTEVEIKENAEVTEE